MNKITKTKGLAYVSFLLFQFLLWTSKEELMPFKFGFVGKESKSDILAGKVAHKKLKPNYVVSAKEVIKIVFEKKKSRSA